MYYINYRPILTLENGNMVRAKRALTIESFDYRHHAERALDEILFYDPAGDYWVSSKACKNWTANDDV
tara:strand:+ start:360 stop:563 length:204 start_codon:yes stop_codon:yes gene_type:complete